MYGREGLLSICVPLPGHWPGPQMHLPADFICQRKKGAEGERGREGQRERERQSHIERERDRGRGRERERGEGRERKGERGREKVNLKIVSCWNIKR